MSSLDSSSLTETDLSVLLLTIRYSYLFPVDLVVGSTIHGVPKKKCWNKTISSVSGYEDFYNIHNDGHVYDKIDID